MEMTLTKFMSMRKGDGDDDEMKTEGGCACACMHVCMDVCLRVTGDDGDVDFVYVNVQG